jgi:hypothetical protein
MGAHSYRILAESFGRLFSDEKRKQLQVAMDYAPGMDELDLEDWRRLRDALEQREAGGIDGFELEQIVMEVLATQAKEWLELGKPLCHTDWLQKKYN